jgi:ABC-type multidrug transport system permease subunit
MKGKLTLISAPAGFGKTTVLADWIQSTKRNVAWLSLEENDNNIAQFFNYVIAALQCVDSRIGEDVQAALERPQIPPPDALLGRLINEIAASGRELVTDPEATNTRAALSGLAKSVASQVGAQQVANNATIGLFVEQGLKTGHMEMIGPVIQQVLMGQQGNAARKSYIKYKTEKVGDKEAENAANWVVSGYLVMFVFFAAAQSAEMIVRERQNLTLERLLTSSVRKESILGGVFLGTSAKGLLQIIIFWLVGIFIFKADLGRSPAAVVLVSILMVLMSAAFSVMLATLVKTQRSAGSVAVLASLTLAPLGGCWWPLSITPRWMQFIAKVTPHAWANIAFNKLMLFGADFSSVVPEMLALVGFMILFGAIAVWRFNVSAVQAQ